MYEQISEPSVGSAAIGRTLAVMSIVEFACENTPAVADPTASTQAAYNYVEYGLAVTDLTNREWRNDYFYELLQAQKVGRLILNKTTSHKYAAVKLNLLEDSIKAANSSEFIFPSRANIQNTITRMACYDAAKRIGLFNSAGDDLTAAARAAYDFKAVNPEIQLGEVSSKRCAEIARAHRVYSMRAFETMVKAEPYQQIQASEEPSATAWWAQLSRDLQTFSARTV